MTGDEVVGIDLAPDRRFVLAAMASIGQRVWKRQPSGGFAGFGSSPGTCIGANGRSGSTVGTADRRAVVYGCLGAKNLFAVGASSMRRPTYMTATRDAICATTLRS
jgi:hypothetical protein